MRNLFNRTLSILCAVMLLISVASAWADAKEAATPTNLNPAEEEIVVDPAEEEIIPEKSGEEPQPEPVQEPEAEPEQEEPEAEPEQEEPEAESEQDPEEVSEEESTEEDIDSVEVVITKTLIVGQSWEGKMKKTKPAVLKLDISSSGMVYILVEGKDVWATAEKSDRITENPFRTETDPETDQMLLKFQAEEGSYLITLGPVEPNLLAQAKVTVMGQNAYEAWKEEQAEPEAELQEVNAEEAAEGTETGNEETAESKPESEPEANIESDPDEADNELVEEQLTIEERSELLEIEKEPEEPAAEEQEKDEKDEEVLPEESIAQETIETDETEGTNETETIELPEGRSVTTRFTWDDEHPTYGSVAHFKATLTGYETVDYSLQWQWSADNEIWNDVNGETEETMDIVYTQENGDYYWRLLIYIIMPDEN